MNQSYLNYHGAYITLLTNSSRTSKLLLINMFGECSLKHGQFVTVTDIKDGWNTQNCYEKTFYYKCFNADNLFSKLIKWLDNKQ